ncbi:MAG: GNAT family N-acetyltransferase [Lactobacillales bacterium]|jgi:ribosomal-protein-alanine N-acetyltransferase|nr:GNAT family N-acetyltransferase [Lactobacillales bacterium]
MEKNILLGVAENIRIETERLILRPVTLEDAEDLYEYASDDEVTKFVFPTHKSLEETKETIVNFFMTKPLGHYGIEWKETGKMIGTMDYNTIDIHERVSDIGYTINKNYWRRGVATEALQALLRIGFEEVGFQRLYAEFDTENPNSGRVMEKSGMLKVGTFKRSNKYTHEMRLFTEFGLTKAEYFSKKEA